MTEIIGRDLEQSALNSLYHSSKSEFIAVYGRRRIGKTFLIREMFKDRFAFYHTGLSPFELNGKKLLSEQLRNFTLSLARYGSGKTARNCCPNNYATSHCHWRVTVQETPLLLPAGWKHSIY